MKKEIVNVSPHPMTFQSSDGETYSVPPSGVVLNATPTEELASSEDGVEFVRVVFTASEEALAQLAELERKHPGALIVGSIIAAQAFPGRVYGMIAAPGFERRPPEEKRMRDNKFTTFG